MDFPPVDNALPDGLLAIGGDLSQQTIIEAYRNGIFPWYSQDEPILWWCPDPRFVLFPHKLKISKSMRSILNKNIFKVTYNQEFEQVITACGEIDRNGQDGTWITEEILEAYINLHRTGWAHSVEVWFDNQLVGGLYGVKMGKCFFGESMFSRMSNASKYGFIIFVEKLKNEGIQLIDCQVYTSHLESLGAEMISRNQFTKILKSCI